MPRQICKAMTYEIKLWDELSEYLQGGLLEIDNKLVENVPRSLALEKKCLFAQTGPPRYLIHTLVPSSRDGLFTAGNMYTARVDRHVIAQLCTFHHSADQKHEYIQSLNPIKTL